MPNPFSPLDRLEFDFELPSLPQPLERADRWFDRLSEVQRIGVALLGMLFLIASALYLLGLGSTVLVNRAEAEYAVREAEYAAALPTAEPTVTMPGPGATTVVEPTAPSIPTALPTTIAQPTPIPIYPTPIPAQLLPTIPIQAPAQRAVAPVEAPRPRNVAQPEPPTPTPPVRAAPPSAKPANNGAAPGRTGAPVPAQAAPVIVRTPTPVPVLPRAAATTAPAAKPTAVVRPPAAKPTAATKPATAPLIQNPFPNAPAIKPNIVSTPRPAVR